MSQKSQLQALKSIRTAADNAWAKIFSKSFPKEIENELHDMFSDTEYLERRDFTMLQRIVLGLVGKDLRTELEASTKEINTRDSNGRTALFIAAERNDLPAVNVLLEYGADPNIICPDQGAPLHFAAIARGSCCIAPLLRHGANIEGMTSWRQTALHYVAAYKNDEHPAKMLLEAGANLDSRDLDGITPLQWAVVSNSEKVVKILLGSGANINNVDNSNNTAVRSAITANRHKILSMLVDHGFSLEVPWSRDGTLLHEIANSADVKTMEIMQRVDLTHIPIDRLDSKSLTALEVLQSREDLSAEITEPFACLVKSQALVPKPGSRVSSTGISKPPGTKEISASGLNGPHAEQGRDVIPDQRWKHGLTTGSAMKRAAWVENAGKLVRGTATNIKLQRDILCVVLLAYAIALFGRFLWRVSR